MSSKARVLAGQRPALMLLLAMVVALGVTPAARADGELTPTLKASLSPESLGSRANDLIIEGAFAYVATDTGLTIVDISDPLHPSKKGSVDLGSNGVPEGDHRGLGLAKKGKYVFLAASDAGMQVIDVTDPSAPQWKPNPLQTGKVFDVVVHPTKEVAYAVSYNGELYVWDISNPEAPVLRQTIGVIRWGVFPCAICMERMKQLVENGQSYLTGVAVTSDGSRVVTADWGYGGLYQWSTSEDGLTLTFRGTHRFKNSMSRMEIDSRGIVYVLLTYGGVHSGVLSVPLSLFYSSDPDDPAFSRSATSNTPVNDPRVCPACGYLDSGRPMDGGGIGLSPKGTYAFYVGGRDNGELRILDVTDPVDMVTKASVPVGPPSMDLYGGTEAGIVAPPAYPDHLFVAAGLSGLLVYEVPGLSREAVPPPAEFVTSFAINAGATSTTNRTVTLDNTVSGSPSEYRAGQSSDLSGAAWQPYAAAPTFTLAGANGTLRVFFQIRSATGVESAVASDAITLNEPVPAFTAFAIDGGAGSTASRTVTLNNAATGGPTEYRASESSTFAGAAWLPYSPAPAFVLSAGNVTKRVYIQLRSLAGTSVVRSDTILLAEPAPSMTSFAINGGAGSTASRTVTLNNTATGGPTEYRASESSTFAGATWTPYSPAPAFVLSAGNVTKRVYIQLRNAAGVPSTVRSDTILLSE